MHYVVCFRENFLKQSTHIYPTFPNCAESWRCFEIDTRDKKPNSSIFLRYQQSGRTILNIRDHTDSSFGSSLFVDLFPSYRTLQPAGFGQVRTNEKHALVNFQIRVQYIGRWGERLIGPPKKSEKPKPSMLETESDFHWSTRGSCSWQGVSLFPNKKYSPYLNAEFMS